MSDDYSIRHQAADEGETTAVDLGFAGVELASGLMSPEEWKAAGRTGTPTPVILVTIHAVVLESPTTAVILPPVLVDLKAAGMLITAITKEFGVLGMGAALTSVIDQVGAHYKATNGGTE